MDHSAIDSCSGFLFGSTISAVILQLLIQVPPPRSGPVTAETIAIDKDMPASASPCTHLLHLASLVNGTPFALWLRKGRQQPHPLRTRDRLVREVY